MPCNSLYDDFSTMSLGNFSLSLIVGVQAITAA